MDKHIEDSMEDKFIPMTSITSGIGQAFLPDIFYLPIQIVNISFIGDPNSQKGWVLVDAGMPHSSDDIFKQAEERFGRNSKPEAIILTHGHFDHVGALAKLVEKWEVPVYAHPLEIPYLTGKKRYPSPDPTVEGGLLAKISPLYPTEPIDLGSYIEELPFDGSVPYLPDWKWIGTPGHSEGHVSFYRESDGTLIAGDAFITVKQDSFFKVLSQKQEINGPPRYLTTDWRKARKSVEKLQALNPNLAVCGHGIPMTGIELKNGLAHLTDHFNEIAKPDYGKYV